MFNLFLLNPVSVVPLSVVFLSIWMKRFCFWEHDYPKIFWITIQYMLYILVYTLCILITKCKIKKHTDRITEMAYYVYLSKMHSSIHVSAMVQIHFISNCYVDVCHKLLCIALIYIVDNKANQVLILLHLHELRFISCSFITFLLWYLMLIK